MRKNGFYGLDDFGKSDLQLTDFEKLITSDVIKIIGQKAIL